jgi:hypothetical protein
VLAVAFKSMINGLVALFGRSHIPYFLVGLTVLFAFVALASVRDNEITRRRGFDYLFLFVAGLTLLAWRWPTFLWQNPMNPDEALWVAAAIKTTVDWVPWRGFDLGTSGPLSAYLLALPAVFGQRIDFFSTRLLGVCLHTITIAGLFYTMKWLNGARIARLAVVPPVILLALTNDWNFLHFSSEVIPVMLTTTALAASAYLGVEGRPKGRRLGAVAVAGLCLGSTGLAKLQSLPIAFLLMVFVIMGIFWGNRLRWSDILREALLLVLSLCVVPAGIVATLWKTGEWQYARQVFLTDSVEYVKKGQQLVVPLLSKAPPWYFSLLVPSLVIAFVAVAALLYTRKPLARASICHGAASLLFLFAASTAIYIPHRSFPGFSHYLLFSLAPLSCCIASLLTLTRQAGLWINRETLISVSYLALFLVPALAVTMSSGPSSFIREIRFNSTWIGSNTAIAIVRHVRPGGRMAIWGAGAQYYAQTQTVMATRFPQLAPYRPGKGRDAYYPRYMRDLKANMPDIFVDAVSPGAWFYHDRATKGYETFPELAEFVRDYYTLKEEVDGVRIFVLKGK